MSERKLAVKNQINDFIKATKNNRRELCSFGVEFEYQREEIDCNCDTDILYDMDGISDAEWDYAEEEFYDEFLNCIPLYSFSSLFRKSLPQSLIKISNSKFWGKRKVARYLANKLKEKYSEYITAEEFFEDNLIYFRDDFEAVKDHVMQELRARADIDWEGYRYENHNCDDAEIATAYEWTTDQSVSGGEIRTEGACSYREVVDASDQIISDIEKSEGTFVDNECSAHLHVKLGDIQHHYGKGILHGLIMEYFSFNKHRLPKCVQHRLVGGGNRWIEPELKHSKYTWVHFHRQGTIEFRLFGGVTNVNEMKVCIDEALSALAYGYKQKANGKIVDDTSSFYRRLAA